MIGLYAAVKKFRQYV